MDTIKILLGATIALLLAAVAMSWRGMQSGMANAKPEEIARIHKQIEELRLETARIQSEQRLANLPPQQQPQIAPSTVAQVPANEQSNRIAELEEQLAEQQAAKAKAERDARVYRDEAGLVAGEQLANRDKDLKRGRQIADALLMARVKEYVEDKEVGSFAVIGIEMPEQVKSGTELSLRRNGGILGRLIVGDVTGNEAVANPVAASFLGGKIELKPGDELIIAPPF